MHGKVLFVIGFVLNVLMVFFGIWPTYLYLLIMLFGLALALLVKNKEEYTAPRINFEAVQQSLKKASLKVNVSYVKKIFLRIIIGSFIILAGCIILLILYRPYQKERQAVNKCEEIITAIESYKQETNSYPNNLHDIIGNNPLRRDWTKDSWDNNYLYEKRNNSFILISKGKDGVIGTVDDIKCSSKIQTR